MNDVIRAIDRAFKEDLRLVILYGNVETGEVWKNSIPNRGRIGRTTGTRKIPILLKTRISLGGEAILDQCIVSIREASSNQMFYVHPKFGKGSSN